VPCPHCNWATVLTAETPAVTVPIGGGAKARKQIFRVFLVAATVVVAAGAGIYRYWYFPKNHHLPGSPAAEQSGGSGIAPPGTSAPVAVVPVARPDPWHGLMAGPVTLEKAGGGHLIYAVGRLTNSSDHQRFGVKVALDVFDAANDKVGSATDYTSSIDPGKEWKFKALVTDRTAATAQLTAVTEN
jgi:hypothetical protein